MWPYINKIPKDSKEAMQQVYALLLTFAIDENPCIGEDAPKTFEDSSVRHRHREQAALLVPANSHGAEGVEKIGAAIFRDPGSLCIHVRLAP
jgi:hypothetical protein